MLGRSKDTISAIATPIGEGAISVIRISGDLAISCVSKLFHGRKNLETVKSHSAHFGRIIDPRGNIIDEVICTVFRRPTSFTGEDTVEVSCHGGIHVTRRVLECLLEAGTRTAEPGEFTQRAFLNGKLDLSQAEAIADLIQAQAEKAYITSLHQLEGSLSKEICIIRDRLVKALGILELELDFVEDEIELVNEKELKNTIEEEIEKIEGLLHTYKYGKIWREGVRVVLVGPPNAGKSSLMNALLNENRAIVTNIPGTTRDFIEEKVIFSGVPFRIIDTAGLRQTENVAESEGVKRSWKLAQTADVVILVHDSTEAISEEEVKILEGRHKTDLIIANNKSDLQNKKIIHHDLLNEVPIVETCTLNQEGVHNLINELTKFVISNQQSDNKETVTIMNERHYSALIRARNSLGSTLESIKKRESNEFIAVDLRRAIDSIGEIIGMVTTEEILNNIFAKFCIGK